MKLARDISFAVLLAASSLASTPAHSDITAKIVLECDNPALDGYAKRLAEHLVKSRPYFEKNNGARIPVSLDKEQKIKCLSKSVEQYTDNLFTIIRIDDELYAYPVY